ncbi:energy-coupling factor transporter transmembrane component T family protein [Brachybacterium sacelli]|uniref:Energy-coupling factor transport system permease protein n=1 Tax=Brachybacterium sacelli TaxID=173364 RepID=A0ABS4X080_9MICO|nr:energy-coupling factor transporter transmembrane component T [Brachybacterium sacelli]MBP2381850.1 energy-coupling factor transport system permease protein [Brachybacterium sacelli]
MSSPVLGYIDRPGPLHALSGVSKLALSLGVVLGAMIGFDVRFLAVVSVGSIVLWALSRVRVRDLAVVLWLIVVFVALNNIGIFLFGPGYGTELFGTRHLLLDGPWRWDVTAEQLFYQLAVTLKYVAVLPAVLLFVATTRPPEFASSLARIGVPYRFAYAVSLALRYIPDVQREFRTISQAQQARGLDTTAGAGLRTRLRNLTSVLMPLLLGTFDRIESVSAAMELRGFGRGRGRTWLVRTPLRTPDLIVIALAAVLVAAPIVLLVVNGGRFWNPFG